MDLVRKISAIIDFCLMTVLLSGCSVGGDSEPPEFSYIVVNFKSEESIKQVLVEKEDNQYHRITNYWSKVEYEEYTALYETLHKGYYTGKTCFIPINSVLTGIQWKDFSAKEHGYWFTKEEIVDEQPFVAYYRIPEHIVGVKITAPWPTKEAVDNLNAIIYNGDIEQYRVDLGY